MKQQLKYTSEGRSGHVIYKDEVSELSFYFEFGGGDCVAAIDIPDMKNWEKMTNRPLAERENIIAFIAEQSRKDQAPSGHYRISGHSIELFSK